jgi:hypothetical protein
MKKLDKKAEEKVELDKFDKRKKAREESSSLAVVVEEGTSTLANPYPL